MSRYEKLRAQIVARPAEMRYRDIRTFLELEGWQLRNEAGSHVTFKKPGYRTIVLSKRGGQMVPDYQLDQICDILGLDD